MEANKICIIGAGIGGLTLGIALKSMGYQVEIFEATKEIKPVGAGIILGCNAMQIFKNLGMVQRLLDKGHQLNSMSITDKSLKILSSVSLEPFMQQYGVANLSIHRADLLQILLDEFNATELHLGKRVINGVKKGQRYILHFEDGSSHQTNNIIGADGIGSKIRALFIQANVQERNTHQICWRGVAQYRLGEDQITDFKEAWGKGSRFGHGQINSEQVYWFALINAEMDKGGSEDWKSYFDEYHPLVKELIHKTKNHAIHKAEIIDLLPIKKWHSEKVCLIGDAAHAMTPNMGQGAGQSIEDAWQLALKMKSYDKLEDAFQDFQSYRYKKVKKIIDQSFQIGKIAQLNSSIAIHLRNSAMKLVPNFIATRQMKDLFTI